MNNKAKLMVNDRFKIFRSEDYNYNFDLLSGTFMRWGRTQEDDPTWSPFGPEIADIEISSGAGCPMSCNMCYKGNQKGNSAENMSLENFKFIFEKFPKYDGNFFLCQVALGITSIASMPDFFPICEYLRSNKVIPNVTINGADPITDGELKKLISLMGAMAISLNKTNFEAGLNLIHRFISGGAKQINVHYVVSRQSEKFAYTLCDAFQNDERLKGLNAIVFLSLKPKERGQFLDILPEDDFKKLIRHCLSNGIRFGADSCSAHKVIGSFDSNQHKMYDHLIEPCEASKFSFYFNNEGKHYPCSFLEGENRDIWKDGIDLTKITDFVKEVWNNTSVAKFRDDVTTSNKNGNNCCHYKI